MRRYETRQSIQRCTIWLQEQEEGSTNLNAGRENHPEDSSNDPLSEPLQESFNYSADEEVSNHSQPGKRHERIISHDEELSEFSEVSQEPHRHKHPTQEDVEMDTSVASEEGSEVTAKKPLTLKEETLDLHCAWKNCHFSTSELEPFVSHVSCHIPELEVRCSEEENEEVYKCLWESCDFETPNSDEVTRHVNFHSHHTKVKCVGALICKSWKLPECSYDAAGVNLVPDLPEPMVCLWNGCTYTSNNPNRFYGHVALHPAEILAPAGSQIKKGLMAKCLWKGCKSEVPNKARMAEHLRVHSKERLCACPTCGALYSSRMRLIDHINRQAPVECLTYQCTHCSRSYPSERILRDHMRHHVNHYKCQFCDMTCPTPHTLSRHIRHRHIDEKPFSCEYCDYKSKTQYNMKRHINTHSNTVNYTCEEEGCDYSCRTVNMLNWHYQRKHESKAMYCCHMCDGRFSRGTYLTKHLMRKHNFRWPSGHTRFRFYKNHEDGLFRLQTVRYESLDVFEDINRGDGEHASIPDKVKQFNIIKSSSGSENVVANFIVREEGSDEDPDDPDILSEETRAIDISSGGQETSFKDAQSMPNLDFESPRKVLISIDEVDASGNNLDFESPRKVLISIDEVDASGNIIHSKTVEAKELTDMHNLEMAHVITDGTCIF